jgi:outer membrane protein OmpA-like peptidoglycan-associated protein
MRISCLITLLLASTGCGGSAAESGAPAAAGQVRQPIAASAEPQSASRPPADPATAPEIQQPQPKPPGLLESLGFGKTGPPLPEGLELGGDCPPVSGPVEAEIAEQARALVPLKVGLTLVNLWKPTEAEEYECTTQITAVHRDGIDLAMRCDHPERDKTHLRRICRSDLTAARMLHTGVGVATVIGESGELPETVVGATEFSLSRQQYAALKKDGQTSHHYVQVGGEHSLAWEAKTTLKREGAETREIAVNGQPVKLPVIRASGETEISYFGKVERGRVTALIADDQRFPMLVDYIHTLDSSPVPRFRLYFPKITYPGADAEGELARRGKLIVHGIYFDFNSDRIRKESDPILEELGTLLARHPEWTLSINGHTDNVGGDAYNQRLSQRRAASVVRWLVERHGIAAARLRSAGLGASSPIETNDTPDGRARNRRVELVRVEDPPADPPRQ